MLRISLFLFRFIFIGPFAYFFFLLECTPKLICIFVFSFINLFNQNRWAYVWKKKKQEKLGKKETNSNTTKDEGEVRKKPAPFNPQTSDTLKLSNKLPSLIDLMRAKWTTLNVLRFIYKNVPLKKHTLENWMLLHERAWCVHTIHSAPTECNTPNFWHRVAQAFRRVWMEFHSFLFFQTKCRRVCVCVYVFCVISEFLDEVITKNAGQE